MPLIPKGKRVDENRYFSANAAMKNQFCPIRLGWSTDRRRSLVVNPTGGDYRVAEKSPAKQDGSRIFPMDQFGVQETFASKRFQKLRFYNANIKATTLIRPRHDGLGFSGGFAPIGWVAE